MHICVDVEPFFTDDGSPDGWSHVKTTKTGFGWIHGPWGCGKCRKDGRNEYAGEVCRIFYFPEKRNSKSVRIQTRYWAIDTWDRGDKAYVKLLNPN